jgi:oligoendopeptidase F
MTIDEILKIAASIIVSLGGSALLLGAFSHWLGSIWAKRMLQNERSKHEESLQRLKAKNEAALEDLKAQIDTLKQKELSRHFDKLSIFKDIVHIISEILRELEAVATSKQETISKEVEHSFALNRNKAYGYISLVSSQEVMDCYNEMIDFFIPLLYEGKQATWAEMREKADLMLNAMRNDLGIKEGNIVYKGER